MVLSLLVTLAELLGTSLLLRRCRRREVEEALSVSVEDLDGSRILLIEARLLTSEEGRDMLAVEAVRGAELLREMRLELGLALDNVELIGCKECRRPTAGRAGGKASGIVESLADIRLVVVLRFVLDAAGSLTSMMGLLSGASWPDGEETGWSKMLSPSASFCAGAGFGLGACESGSGILGA